MIRDLYADMLKNQGADGRTENRYREEISELTACYEKQLEAAEYKKMQEAAFLIAAMAEENGFEEGVKYAFHLFAECIA